MFSHHAWTADTCASLSVGYYYVIRGKFVLASQNDFPALFVFKSRHTPPPPFHRGSEMILVWEKSAFTDKARAGYLERSEGPRRRI